MHPFSNQKPPNSHKVVHQGSCLLIRLTSSPGNLTGHKTHTPGEQILRLPVSTISSVRICMARHGKRHHFQAYIPGNSPIFSLIGLILSFPYKWSCRCYAAPNHAVTNCFPSHSVHNQFRIQSISENNRDSDGTPMLLISGEKAGVLTPTLLPSKSQQQQNQPNLNLTIFENES